MRLRLLAIPLLLLLPLESAAQDRKADSGLDYSIQKGSPQGGRPPLILFLHGTGGGRHCWAAYASEAVKRGYVVALPLSPGVGTPQSGNTSGDKLKRWDQADIPTVCAFAKELVQKEGADPKRVYLAGYSNGAWLGATIALGNPDIFSAFLCMGGGCAGKPWQGKEELARDMGVYIVHGDQDNSVPVKNGRDFKKSLEDGQFPHVVYKEFPGRGHDVFSEEIKPFFDWLPKFKKTARPGSNTTLPWIDSKEKIDSMPDDQLAFVYLFSPKDKGHAATECFELELFTEKGLATLGLLFVRLDRDANADWMKELKISGPAILIVDKTRKVLAKWSAPATPRSILDKIKSLAKKK